MNATSASAMPDTRPRLEEMFRRMLLIRRVEEEAARAYSLGKIGGFLHLYIGQEAVAVGAVAAIQPTDYVVTTYRDHGLAIAKGMSARACMAELFGKATGCSKGLGGSMHLFDAQNRFMGGHGIVGAHIPLAAGIAFAAKYRNERTVTLCFFGEGAVSIGAFHEGLSLAALWKLPIVFVCENNEYAMGTPLERSLSIEDVSAKATSYGIPRDRLFVTDVLDVERTMAAAVARARDGQPSLVEMRTYRFRGHSMSDPGKYRTAAELDKHKAADPLTRARRELLALGRKEDDLKAIEAAVEEEVQDAVRFADTSPEPGPEILEPTTYTGPFAS